QAADLAMFHVTDNARMFVNAGQQLGSTHESAARQEVETQSLMKPAQSEGFAIGIGRQPDIGHSSAVNEFLQIKAAKRTPSRRGIGGLIRCVQHRIYVARRRKRRYWEKARSLTREETASSPFNGDATSEFSKARRRGRLCSDPSALRMNPALQSASQ